MLNRFTQAVTQTPVLDLVAVTVLALLFVDLVRDLGGIVVQLIEEPEFAELVQYSYAFEIEGRVIEYGSLLKSAVAFGVALGTYAFLRRRAA